MAARAARPTLARSLLAAGAAAELLILFAPIVTYPRSKVLEQPPSPSLALLQHRLADGESRFLAVPSSLGRANTGAIFGVPDLRQSSPMPVRRYAEYLNAIEPPSPGRYPTDQTVDALGSPLLDLAAVRYLVSSQPVDGGFTRLLASAGDVFIGESTTALPRTRVVHASRVFASEEESRAALDNLAILAAQVDDTALLDTALLEPSEDGDPPPVLDGALPAADETAAIDGGATGANPDRLVINAHLDTPGLLLIADTYYPGWQARVDGVASPIYPADLLFRAVAVDAGTHRVELDYRPRSLRDGLLVGAAGLLVVFLLAGVCVWPRAAQRLRRKAAASATAVLV
jgi:hypothetical protein